MLLSLDDDFTDDPAKDAAQTSLCLVQLPVAAFYMTIHASCPPHWGLVIVRMSPLANFIYLFDRFCDGNTVVKDALIPDPSLEVDDTGSGGRSYF